MLFSLFILLYNSSTPSVHLSYTKKDYYSIIGLFKIYSTVMSDFLGPELQLWSHLVIHQVLNRGPHRTGAHSASLAILAM